MRLWCNGSTPVFKTGVAVSKAAGVGSNPTGRAKVELIIIYTKKRGRTIIVLPLFLF